MLGVSGLLGGLLFTYLSLPTYQGLVKSSLLNFTSNVDIGSIMSREDVRQIVMEQELSRDQIKNLVTQQYQQQSWFNALSASQQEQLIENATTETYNAQINNREQNVDNMYNFLKDRRLSLPSVTGDLIERIPLTKAMLDLMPIFTGLLLMSAITVFGQFFVGPFLALFSLGLKEKIPTNP